MSFTSKITEPDFGCGIGDSTWYLSEIFPGAKVHGIDTAENAMAHVQNKYPQPQVSFQLLDEFDAENAFDLCYVNGVFHHIPPGLRHGAVAMILKALKPGGLLALFENNPWNPGTRMVMSRIPFDSDAITLSPPETRSMVLAAGFKQVISTRFLFYFPRALSAFRILEPLFVSMPLGAQYYVLAQK